MDELTGRDVPTLWTTRDGGWESGSCEPFLDSPDDDALEQLGRLRMMLDIALQRRDEQRRDEQRRDEQRRDEQRRDEPAGGAS